MDDKKPLGPIHQGEIKVLTFPFADELAAQGTNLTLTLAFPCSVTPVSGQDANAALMLVGDPVISGTEVKQRVQPGVSGVIYKLRARAQDDAGNRHVVDLLLAVED